MRDHIAVLVAAISTLACTTVTPEGAQVRVTRNADVVRGCDFISNAYVSSVFGGDSGSIAEQDLLAKMQNEAAVKGGNVLYLTSVRSDSPQGTAMGEIYRCSSSSAAPRASAAGGPVAAAPSVARAVIPPGFRDLRWGDPVPSGMRLISPGVYVRDSDSLMYGPIELRGIVYFFEENRLTSVALVTVSRSVSELGALLSAQWGPPVSRRERDAGPLWANQHTMAALDKAENGDLHINIMQRRQ